MAKMTVHEHSVEIKEPYSEGHTCTAGEADALNQTFRENVRNNSVASIKRVEEKDGRKLTREEVQEMVSDYAEDYEFGVRSGPSRDPVETEAMERARDIVRKAIRAKGYNMKDYAAAKVTELAKSYLSGPAGPKLREIAAQTVKARELTTQDLQFDLPAEQAAAAA